jgi:PDZ domain-containing protein
MRLTLPATILALAGTAAIVTLPAALRADESAHDAVERLMPQLLSEDETQRADAEKSLFALGDAGRAELERVTRENDPRRAITALRLLQSPKWAKTAKADGEQRAQREDAGTDPDENTGLEDRLDRMRARLDREMEELRRRFESFDRDFTLRMPQFEWGPARIGGASNGTIVENDKRLSWSIDADGRVKVTVQDGKDAPEQKYEAPSMEALKKEHPDVATRLESATRTDDWTVTLNGGAGPHVQLRRGFRDGQRKAEVPDDLDAPATPVLGVTWSPVPDVLREQLDLGGGGIVVEGVVNKSLAEKLGLARNDVLLEVQGKPVSGSADVRAALENAKEGEKVTALVVRKGQRKTLEAVK